MIYSDLMRSYQQYQRRIEMGLTKISFLQKIILSVLFFVVLFFSVLLALWPFKKQSKKETIALIDYSEKEPHRSIKEALLGIEGIFLVKLQPTWLPVLPMHFYKPLLYHPSFVLKNLTFLGALSIQVSKYYNVYKKLNMKALIVLQEYSFQMSYLTYLIEYDGGKLYNIMHGVPGHEAAYFRFSKCFIWGSYYKDFFIQNGAKDSQFVVIGSLFHQNLLDKKSKSDKTLYDVVYLMQGQKHIAKDEIEDVLSVLSLLATKYKVVVKQHPIYPVSLPVEIPVLAEMELYTVFNNSQVVISHFSTSLLDAKVFGLATIAYSKMDRNLMLEFMDKEDIVSHKEVLARIIRHYLNHDVLIHSVSGDFIDFDIDTLSILKKEMNV